ncbi:MAG: bifunctional diaminohydroxyphosphoribosylaminopyrimidine deaminase/5-amino-6-(5-phosphoribosylamino)uracil reductase RibD [Bacteroidetes bacterium]|nr:bifunctional diaminohydroxyphosphoribosylaminopyrimidine deaminase/5-amino-6-(5-phosphoribosylamino)uracil reductase RibD [Bacteroidota bacterium]
MTTDEKYMNRCLKLANLGAGSASPNPMVGCVIVCNGEIIGEGYHQKHGEAHAEVNAINSVKNPKLLKESTIYVTLEPCAHFGLTPPCSDLIVENQIPKVVIGTIDPFAKVAGKGIEKLKNAGIEVEVGVLGKECREINKRFFTFHEKKRPYIILKWAQTLDGFIDVERTEKEFGEPTWITGQKALHRVHEIRAVEDAIFVGTNTALKDNPSLTVRHCPGKNPVRIVLDNQLRLPERLNLFDGSVKTIVFNSKQNKELENILFVKIDFDKEIIPQILDELYNQNILSAIVEGGKQLLQSFINAKLWDEAHLFIGNKYFYNGINAPQISGKIISSEKMESDKLIIYKNR